MAQKCGAMELERVDTERKKMKTLLIYLRLGNSHRNILRTDLFTTLKSNPDLRIVIVSPLGNEPYLRSEFSSDRIVVEALPKTRADFFERRLKDLKTYLWLWRNPPRTFQIRREARRQKGLWDRFAISFQDWLAKWMDRSGINEKRISAWEVALFHRRKVRKLFERHRPDAVLFTKLHSTNIHVVKEAKKRNVQTICFVEGWDNLTSKGPFAVIPDHILVWNEQMKREIVEYHQFPAEKIDVVGIPQFDFYYDRSKFCDRDAFFGRYGLDPKLKLITYCIAGGIIAPSEPEIIDQFYQAMMKGSIGHPAQLLVRMHPNTRGKYLQEFERFKGLPRLYLQPAGRVAKIQDGWDPSWEDMVRLGETMVHSNVVINIFSTITLDAIAFDTPVVGVGFEGTTTKSYPHPYRYYYEFTHFNPVVRNGGIRVAYSLTELVQAVNAYLENPALDAAGRDKVRREQIHSLDGKSSVRAGKAILKAMGMAGAGKEGAHVSAEAKVLDQLPLF